eukprot:2934118-Alexandrium_andersonii.AAC.1
MSAAEGGGSPAEAQMCRARPRPAEGGAGARAEPSASDPGPTNAMEVDDNPSARRVARGGVERRAHQEDPPPRGGVRGTTRRAGSEPAAGGLRGEAIY